MLHWFKNEMIEHSILSNFKLQILFCTQFFPLVPFIHARIWKQRMFISPCQNFHNPMLAKIIYFLVLERLKAKIMTIITLQLCNNTNKHLHGVTWANTIYRIKLSERSSAMEGGNLNILARAGDRRVVFAEEFIRGDERKNNIASHCNKCNYHWCYSFMTESTKWTTNCAPSDG